MAYMNRNINLSTVLQVLTLLLSLVSAIGVLIINSKVDWMDGQAAAMHELLIRHTTTPGVHSD